MMSIARLPFLALPAGAVLLAMAAGARGESLPSAFDLSVPVGGARTIAYQESTTTTTTTTVTDGGDRHGPFRVDGELHHRDERL